MLVPMAQGRATTPKGPPRIHPLVPALLAVVVCAVLILVVAKLVDDDPAPAAAPAATSTTASTTTTAPTTTTTTAPDPVAVEDLVGVGLAVDAPRTYRITFDVVENGLTREETVTVRRPYESLVLSTRDGRQLSGTATSRTHLRTYLSDREAWFTMQPLLHRAAYDQRPAGAVGAMARLGLVEEIGPGEFAGRACTVFRTGEPTSSSQPTAASDEEHTDLCIDGSGLVLWEHWRLSGKTVMERTATSVETGFEVDPAIFDPTPEVDDEDEFAGAFSTIAVEADEETLARLRTRFEAPEGYTYDGAVFRAANPTQGGTSSEIVRFYSGGPDLLELSEQFIDRPAELGGGSAVPVEVEGWDEVWFDPGFRNSSLRARLSESSWVELRHHDIGFLFRTLGALTRVEG